MTTIPVIDHFLLSHHVPAEQHRCVVVGLCRRRYLVCTRCFGAAFGFLIGIPLFWWDPLVMSPWLLLLAFPDWIAHSLAHVKGMNMIRFVSGTIIGLMYALNMQQLLHLRFPADLWLVNLLAVVVYVTVVWLTMRSRRSEGNGKSGVYSNPACSTDGPQRATGEPSLCRCQRSVQI